jgi:cyanophycinase-like exopeptidase
MATNPRLIAILGSGETAPGMVRVYRNLLARLDHVRGVILDTPCGFQENADAVVTRLHDYFATHLGQNLATATLRDADAASETARARFVADVSTASLVFSGPGSPSYALRHWSKTPLAELLREKFEHGGVVVFSSGAAVTLGTFAAPIYEIYKVGEPPRWLSGLDVLAPLGIRTAVMPHFDNREGRDHDTRFCYLGRRRMRMLEAQLDPDVVVIGVDEHTMALIDGDDGTLRVMGRGSATLLRAGVVHQVRGDDIVDLAPWRSGDTVEPRSAPRPAEREEVATDDVDALIHRLDQALADADADTAVELVLSLQTEGSERALAGVRRGVVRLGDLARAGASSPDAVDGLAEALIALRDQARNEQHYAVADHLRDVLASAGIDVRDTPDGSRWDRSRPAGTTDGAPGAQATRILTGIHVLP